MSKQEEFQFPELTPEAKAAWNAACIAGNVSLCFHGHISTRRFFAAFLREAMKQAFASAASQRDVPWNADQMLNALIEVRQAWDLLEKIANNFYSPPPPAALAQSEPQGLPPNYIDREHAGADRHLLDVFYQACQSEGGTADEIHLRGLRAVLAARPPAPPAPEVGGGSSRFRCT